MKDGDGVMMRCAGRILSVIVLRRGNGRGNDCPSNLIVINFNHVAHSKSSGRRAVSRRLHFCFCLEAPKVQNPGTAAMAAPIASKKLPSGHSIPVIGLGVWRSEPGEQTINTVLNGLKIGYRHVDTAQYYRNEADVGKAIAASGLPRGEVFVTSKYYAQEWSYDEVLRAVKESVERIGGGYIDLYLLHAPGNAANRADAWRALEDAQSQGLLRDIGVSNFGEDDLKKLSETWRVKPAVNQIELHPWQRREELVKFIRSEGILVQAYSPLAKAHKLNDPLLAEIAEQIQATPAQVALAWSLAKDFITLPKSVNPTRQQQNLDSYKIALTAEQIAKLDALEEFSVFD